MERALRQHLPGGAFADVTMQRSKAMSAVRGRANRTTEQRLRFGLVRAGIKGWQVRPKGLRGNPDFLFPERRVAIFVDGCFWHGCALCGHVPKTNPLFWAAKIERNRERDRETSTLLEADGYRVLRFWEHELQEALGACVARIRDALRD